MSSPEKATANSTAKLGADAHVEGRVDGCYYPQYRTEIGQRCPQTEAIAVVFVLSANPIGNQGSSTGDVEH